MLLTEIFFRHVSCTNIAIKIPNTNTRLACLLWMDDVLILETRVKEKQTLLDITNKVAKKYHIKCRKEKSQTITIGNPEEKPQFKLGQMDLDITHKYKYLGEMINNKMNLKDQITQTESKVEAAYQAITAMAGDRHYTNIQMNTVWKLVCSCLTPIITYAGETRNPNEAKNKKFNQILDNILKRILMVPTPTPREALYIETGLLYVETLNDKNRIVMSERLHRNGNKTLNEITNKPAPGAWKDQLQKTREKYNITEEALREGDTTPSDFIKRKIHEAFRERIEN